MREKIYLILEGSDEKTIGYHIYNIFMAVVIVLGVVPIFLNNRGIETDIIDTVVVTVFIVDYALRLMTADYKLGKGKKSFLLYPFTFLAIVDLLAILSGLDFTHDLFRALKLLRLFKFFAVFSIMKGFRHSEQLVIMMNVFKKQKQSLLAVVWLTALYIMITSLIMYSVEPQTFKTFFDALYWSIISLETVGYGDIYATSTIGRVFTIISVLFGVIIVALPASIITAGYMDEIRDMKDKKNEDYDEEE